MLKNKLNEKKTGNYQLPGVYIEEVNNYLKITEEESGVPIFIGYTEKLTADPIKISSYIEFESIFGKISSTVNENFPTKNFLACSLDLFFKNGGSSCFVVSCGNHEKIRLNDFIRCIDALEDFNKGDVVAVPELVYFSSQDYNTLVQKILQFCNETLRFAIFDLPFEINQFAEISEFRKNLSTQFNSNGALYFPHLISFYEHENVISKKDKLDFSIPIKILDDHQLISQKKVKLPSCGAIAGVYQNNDIRNGVWKAPANVTLNFINNLNLKISDIENSELNVDNKYGISINAIRCFFGRGVVVWGGRTMQGNSNEWRYISVKRLSLLIEKSIRNSLQGIVFLPNQQETWKSVEYTVETYFYEYWKKGALKGAKAKDAYFVRCGLNTTMTINDIDNKHLILEYGLASLRPAEFTIHRLIFEMN